MTPTKTTLGSILLLAATVAAHGQPPVQHERALEVAMDDLELDAPVIVGDSVSRFPVSGVECESFKIRDADGLIHTVVLDQYGNVLIDEEIADNEVAARESRDGNIDAAVWEYLDTVHDHEQIRVAIWLDVPAHSPAAIGNLDHDDPAVSSRGTVPVDGGRLDVVRARAASVTTRLEALGVVPRYRDGSAIVYGTMRASNIPDLLGDEAIDRIYLDPVHEALTGTARRSIKAHKAESRGFDGAGVQVAVIEVGGKFKRINPYLDSDILQDSLHVALSGHTTSVVGIIRSDHPEHTGVAAGCTLRVGGSETGSSSELQDRTEAAVDWGATVVNISFGSDANGVLSASDRFYDRVVFEDRVTVCAAAGNNTGSGHVLAPATGYGVIAVGNYDNMGTAGWGDDSMSLVSSWKDPVSSSSDREKPDVVAPGHTVRSTSTSSPWTGVAGTGTSFSAPMVTGVVAQMMQQAPSLTIRPEAVRAILMVTARNNLEGEPDLSERDGAGGIDGWRADRVIRGKTGGWSFRTYDCATRPANWLIKKTELKANKKARVAIVWGNDPDYGLYTQRPGADLDLEIKGPGGVVVTGSYSFDNTFEIVQFTPSEAGMYKFRVVRTRCSAEPAFIAVAWHQP